MLTGKHHVALVKGDVEGAQDVLVRVHSECLTGDVFHSQRCDCGEQLEQALQRIDEEGRGVLLYLAQEGRGIGLVNKLRAYELQEQGLDTVEANLRLGFAADQREYGIGSQILADLGLTTIRVLTNNPKKITGISGFGLSVVSQEPIEVEPNPENLRVPRVEARQDGPPARDARAAPERPLRPRAGLTVRSSTLPSMSDRYETPSWDDEPEDLGSANRVTADAASGRPDEQPTRTGRRPRTRTWRRRARTSSTPGRSCRRDDADEVADEAADHAPDEESDEASAEAAPSAFAEPPAVPDEVEESDEAELAAPALADHVSASSEHAPGDLTVPPGYSVLEGTPSGERRAVGIVVSRFNGDVTTKLLESALDELDAYGVSRESITVMPVPGAFELPLAAMALAKTRRFACIVALGCVIRGDTPHFDYVASEAASGLQLAAIETGVPVAFGVLTLDRTDQAESRQGKGADAVRTALEMADLFANLRAAAAR